MIRSFLIFSLAGNVVLEIHGLIILTIVNGDSMGRQGIQIPGPLKSLAMSLSLLVNCYHQIVFHKTMTLMADGRPSILVFGIIIKDTLSSKAGLA